MAPKTEPMTHAAATSPAGVVHLVVRSGDEATETICGRPLGRWWETADEDATALDANCAGCRRAAGVEVFA